MNPQTPDNLKMQVCVHCKRQFIRYKSWEVYCHLPACQRAMNRQESAIGPRREKGKKEVMDEC